MFMACIPFSGLLVIYYQLPLAMSQIYLAIKPVTNGDLTNFISCLFHYIFLGMVFRIAWSLGHSALCIDGDVASMPASTTVQRNGTGLDSFFRIGQYPFLYPLLASDDRWRMQNRLIEFAKALTW